VYAHDVNIITCIYNLFIYNIYYKFDYLLSMGLIYSWILSKFIHVPSFGFELAGRLDVKCFFAAPWKFRCRIAVWFQEEPFFLRTCLLALPSERKLHRKRLSRSWAPYKHSVQHSVLQCPSTTLLDVECSLSLITVELSAFSSRLLFWISQFVLTTDRSAGGQSDIDQSFAGLQLEIISIFRPATSYTPAQLAAPSLQSN
jgi:hypothetical protein